MLLPMSHGLRPSWSGKGQEKSQLSPSRTRVVQNRTNTQASHPLPVPDRVPGDEDARDQTVTDGSTHLRRPSVEKGRATGDEQDASDDQSRSH